MVVPNPHVDTLGHHAPARITLPHSRRMEHVHLFDKSLLVHWASIGLLLVGIALLIIALRPRAPRLPQSKTK